MKPSKLTICGINSYVTPQTINFKKLSEGSLFGIFGATGSGKSTILDCIIIALYGSSDRDNLSNIINVNVKDAYIKFSFELDREETNVYEVTRFYKLRPSGLSSGAQLVNLTKNETLGDSTDKVNSVLETMLGISKKEFLKCIALPQNEFDKFILDTPTERKKSISKLFNLENFGEDLNRKVKARLDILNVKQLTISEQLKSFGNINEISQKQLENEIKLNEKLIVATEKQIDSLQFELKELDLKYNTTIKLIDAKSQVSDIKSRENYYLALKVSLEAYHSNKENLLKLDEMRKKLIELDEVNGKLKVAELENKRNTQSLSETNFQLSKFKEEQNLLNAKLNVFKVSIEKKKFLMQEIEDEKLNIKILKDKHSGKLDELLNISEHEQKVDVKLNNLLNDISKLNNEIKDNEKILKQISDAILLSESESFIEKLNDLKYGINQTNLDEVEDYKIHKDILSLISKVNKYVLSYKNKITKRDAIIKELKITLDELQISNKEYIKKQTTLNEKSQNLNKKHHELYGLKVSYNSNAAKVKTLINELKTEILNKNANIKNLELQLKNFDDLTDCTLELNEISNNVLELEEIKLELLEDISKNNANIKALQVEQKYLTISIENLKKQIPSNFQGNDFNSEINESNYTTYLNDLSNFEKQKTYFETLVENLNNELNGKPVNTKFVLNKKENLNKLQQTLNETKVKLGIDKTTYNHNVELLIQQNALETELHAIHMDLQLTQKLASYISKNALVDFVSEEYLYLISEYANSFIYKLSRGKYMLKYSSKNLGEFIAVDNFNGGMLRSIKTLSGGERFIFSLGLALGVSQSIAVNNNKSFNFFFIDEGFGNLSEDYIDDVLNCFDGLIKLDFTVGLITHVDKMQEYITNKVVVTKENNEEGSIITEYN